MLSSKCKIKTKCLKSDQPYKVHHTGNFGALGRQNRNDSLVVTVEANSPTLTQRGAQIISISIEMDVWGDFSVKGKKEADTIAVTEKKVAHVKVLSERLMMCCRGPTRGNWQFEGSQ